MHFLLGLLILCIILAVPALRNVAFLLLALAGGGIFLLVLSSGQHRQSPPPVDSARLAQVQAAREAEEREALNRIKPNEIEIRQIQITSWSQPITSLSSTISMPGIRAVIKNDSPRFKLSQVCIQLRLLDCPTNGSADDSRCEQVGSLRGTASVDIPAGQVRQVDLPQYTPVEGIPPLRGRLALRYEVCLLKGVAQAGE